MAKAPRKPAELRKGTLIKTTWWGGSKSVNPKTGKPKK
jgi:hypothetical protein